MRGISIWGSGALVALLAAAATAGAKPGTVNCPISDGTPTGGDVQWAFTDSGLPNGHAIRSSYVHGRGHWTSGRATGTGCTLDFLKQTAGQRDLVLTISGKSKLTGRVTQGGLLGVRIVLPIKVRASDDPKCAKGAIGTVTLFASYYSIHKDTMKVHLGPRCTGHNFSYSGSKVHVYIARHGAQVNTP